MKRVCFLGDSRDAIRAFADPVRYRIGVELRAVQLGLEPSDWKPMKDVAPGAREVRVRDRSGAFRVFYVASVRDLVVVLHAFQKTLEKTPRRDIALAARRWREWQGEHEE